MIMWDEHEEDRDNGLERRNQKKRGDEMRERERE